MPRFLKDRKKKLGLAPGSLVYIADNPYNGLRITVTSYSKNNFTEKSLLHIEDAIPEALEQENVTWIDIEGLSDPSVIEKVGKMFGVHSLWLEDVLNTDHRPKVEELHDILFLIVKAVGEYSKDEKIEFEQVSVLLGHNFILSFHEYPDGLFESVRNRIRQSKGLIRNSKADYLMYALIDCVIDTYFTALTQIGREIEELEESISERIDPDLPEIIMSLKHEILYLSKSAEPIRDTLAQVLRMERQDVQDTTKIYITDAHQHAIHIVSVLDDYRQMLGSLLEFYTSRVNLKLNESIRILTVFTSIFIPLTFIVGVYGMNFKHMPELDWEYGYPMTWVLMIAVAFGMLFYFRRKNWF
jgi:magnesium transporter